MAFLGKPMLLSRLSSPSASVCPEHLEQRDVGLAQLACLPLYKLRVKGSLLQLSIVPNRV